MGSTTGTGTGTGTGNRHLRLDSLPVVDLCLLSQSELLALSVGSSPSSQDDHGDVFLIPKIDRTVFNESAGSRKQTYSRLRLAPSAAAAARRSRPPDPDPDPLSDHDGRRVFALLKMLFGSDALVPVPIADPPVSIAQLQNLPVGVVADSAPQQPNGGRSRKNTAGTVERNPAPEKRRRGRPRKISVPVADPPESSVQLQNNPVAIVTDSAPEKPKRGLARENSFGAVVLENHAPEERKPGRPRKTPERATYATVDFEKQDPVPVGSVSSGSATEKRKRGRPRKNRIAVPVGSCDNPQQCSAMESASDMTNTVELDGQVVQTEQQQCEAPEPDQRENGNFESENTRL